MKLQSWIVVFAIIVIPIVLVMSLYIQVQINYVNLQGNYDTVLNNATYDAIKAFQIKYATLFALFTNNPDLCTH